MTELALRMARRFLPGYTGKAYWVGGNDWWCPDLEELNQAFCSLFEGDMGLHTVNLLKCILANNEPSRAVEILRAIRKEQIGRLSN